MISREKDAFIVFYLLCVIYSGQGWLSDILVYAGYIGTAIYTVFGLLCIYISHRMWNAVYLLYTRHNSEKLKRLLDLWAFNRYRMMQLMIVQVH